MRLRRRSDRRVFVTRRIGIVLLIGLLAAVAPVLHPERVSAASGVDDYPARLKNAGLDALVDPWQFYNRECTSWVAWRLNSENQVAFTDYWQGVHWGNASNWRNAARSLNIPVDDNPTRGAVAWWSAGSAGSSRGHVAWVQTVSDGAITIEEYNYLQAGHVRHPHDLQVQLDVAERLHPHQGHRRPQHRVTGRPGHRAGRQQGHAPATASGARPTSSSTTSGSPTAARSPVPPRSRSSRPPPSWASACAPRSPRRSPARTRARRRARPTDSVAHGVFTVTAEPVISGTPQVGVQLSAGNGTWSPAGAYNYRWYAGDTLIPDATASTFTPTAAELGQPIRVQGHLEAARLHDRGRSSPRPATRSRPGSSRRPRRRRSPVRRRSTRSSPRAPAPGPRPAGSTCSGWPTAYPSTARPARRTP